MSKFAAKTEVPVTASKAEIERTVERYGATGFMSGWSGNQAVIAFAINGRQVRLVLSMPARDAPEFNHYQQGSRTFQRAESAALERWQLACRQRWRALLLVIKAKLEAVECGISVLDDEFMAHIVLPSGRTVSEEISPRLVEAYATGQMPSLLPDYSA